MHADWALLSQLPNVVASDNGVAPQEKKFQSD